MIPKVKTYQITTDAGVKHLVDAPTKLLAKLNFRHDGNYDAIKRIGVVKRRGIMPQIPNQFDINIAAKITPKNQR
jgi:hypothetical protein